MKFTSRQAIWVFALAVTLVLCGIPNLAAAPQSARGLEKGKGHNRQYAQSTDSNYQQGLRDGQSDRANNRRHQYRERSDPRNNDAAQNRAYEAGYDAGFRTDNRQYNRNGDYSGRYDPRGRQVNPYGQNGQYGQGQYGNNAAAQNGYQDGLFDGQKDRQTGHSNRPTQGDWYKSATRGYDSSLGNRDQYKAAYRQAYLPAYQRGYTGR
jgi:hypothetical protein